MRRSGLSARQLAVRAGVSEGRISDYLHGRHDPGVRRLLALLAAADHTLAVMPVADALDRTNAFDRNGLVLPELLDLADALAVGAPSIPPRPAPPRFGDLVAPGG